MPTFPGVYDNITNNSANNTPSSTFSLGLVGPAMQGTFNTAGLVTSIQSFVAQFGGSISGAYIAEAVAAVTPYSGNVQFARIGRQYTAAISPPQTSASGLAGNYQLFTSSSALVSANEYVRVTQPGFPSTVDALVASVSTGTINLVNAGVAAVPLAASYTAAEVDVSTTSNAANPAEVLLQAPVYGNQLVAAGTVIGTKSYYTFTVSGNAGALVVGNVIKITQTGRNTTREAVISNISGQTITLISFTNTATGQQAVPLQDNYTAGQIYVQTGNYVAAITLNAGTAGTWANFQSPSTGLSASVVPGTNPDSKKLVVMLNGASVGTYDNLTMTPTDPNFWGTILAPPTIPSNSTIVVIPTVNGSPVVIGTEPPANTVNPWTVGSAVVNVAQFELGDNGAVGLQDSDYVGIFNPDGTGTGIKVFDDPATFQLFTLAAPGQSGPAVGQELLRVAGDINAFVPLDVPDLLPVAEALDWTNGAGLYSGNPIVNNFRGGFFWNWIQLLNPLTGVLEYVPPSIGYLVCAANTFANWQLWFAAAGTKRGNLQVATNVRYPRVSQAQKQTFFSGNNQMNPILLWQGSSVLLWGNRTTYRIGGQLQNINAVQLVNYIVQGFGQIGINYVFDPNDPTLYSEITNDFESFLDPIVTNQGLETYGLTCNTTNNTSATRSARKVIVALTIIPVEVAEQITLNLTVNSSGAVLNSVNGIPTGAGA